MARNLTDSEISHLNDLLANARCIRDVTAIARVACGYRLVHNVQREVEYTDTDRAWFRKPLRADGGAL